MRKMLLQATSRSSVPFSVAFEEFKRYKKAKNLTDETISFYEDCVRYFRRIF